MTLQFRSIFQSKGEKIQYGLSYRILKLLEIHEPLTLDKAHEKLQANIYYIQDRLSSLLTRDFLFKMNDGYYFSPNVVLITTKKVSKFFKSYNEARKNFDPEKELIKKKLDLQPKSRQEILVDLVNDGFTKHQVFKRLDTMVESGEIKKIKYDMLDQRKIGYCLPMEVIS